MRVMREQILRQLNAEYEQTRLKCAEEEDRRLKEMDKLCPEITQLMQHRQDLIFGGLQGILAGKMTADDLPRRMELTNLRIVRLLKENGKPENYLDPVYRCRTCKDTGYVGEPVKEMCECLKGQYYQRLYQAVGLSSTKEQSFETFNADLFSDEILPGKKFSQRKLMCKTREWCEHWADNYPNVKETTVLFMGQSGLGKTFLMHAMARRLLQRGKQVLLVGAYRFLDAARKAYFGGSHEEIDAMLEADVLMIDDMGTEPMMENITVGQWFNLISERQNSGKGLIISTNLQKDELRNQYTERIASRLLDVERSKLMMLTGKDVRRA